MTRIFVPKDAAALAVGADKVAARIAAEARGRRLPVEIVRTGSRGMFFLEPLIEVETAQGRIGYGPVSASDIASLFDSGLISGGAHPLRVGKPEEHPFWPVRHALRSPAVASSIRFRFPIMPHMTA
jgi:formate dehydrogenase iron-sulfur subunit